MKHQSPAAVPPRDASAFTHASSSPAPVRRPSILVADGSAGARNVMAHTLARADFEVEAVAGGEAAWEALQRRRYDLLITDHSLPRLTGIELIKRIRDAGMNLPVIIASAAFPPEVARGYSHLKLAAVIAKPFGLGKFLNAVRNVLREAAATATGPESFSPAPRRLAAAPGKTARPVQNHVLIADDDAVVRGSLAAVLESEGYLVDEASNGIEAVAHAIKHSPDLVLLDLNMPHADGWTAFSQLDRVTPLLPVIVITARPNQYPEAVRVGVDAFMEKPLNIPVLVRAIKRLTSEDEDRHVRRITNRAFVTQWLGNAGPGGSNVQDDPGGMPARNPAFLIPPQT